MGLETEIQQAIDANLTHEVAGRLRLRLEQADTDASEVKSLRDTLDTSVTELTELRRKKFAWDEVQKLRDEVESQRAILVTKGEVMEARKEERESANKEIYHLARIAFDNPKLKYRFQAGIDVPYKDASGYTGHASQNIDVRSGETTERDEG